MNKFEIMICWFAAWMGFVGVVALTIEWYARRRSRLRKFFGKYREKECPDCLGSGGVFSKNDELLDICERCESYGYVWQMPNHKYKWWMGKLKPEITEEIYDELEELYGC